MNPVTGFGVAVNVIQLVDFASKLVSEAQEIYRSGDAELVEYSELKAVTKDLWKLSSAVQSSLKERRRDPKPLTESEKEQEKLGEDCRRVAAELLSALDKLKIKGKHSRWNSMRQALKTVLHKEEIERLEKRLDRFRQWLIANALSKIREEINLSTGIQALVHDDMDDMKKRYESFGDLLLKHVTDSQRWREDIVEAVHKKSWQSTRSFSAPSLTDMSKLCDDESEEPRPILRMISRQIMHGLRYTDISTRHDRIVERHHQTFEWIYDTNEDDHHTWASFTDWLKNEERLYWITGKPGSGKSTLMKFLFNDPRTLQALQCWRPDTKLMTAGFFFWNSGSRIQMSQEGLLRTLLFQILRQDLNLVSRIFPERFEVCRLFGRDDSPFTWSELSKGLLSLGSLHGEDMCFCFFIDGLDEFDGPQDELLEYLTKLAHLPNIKVCTSSRPWTVFQEAFDTTPSLRVQDLTYSDIQHYVEDKFDANAAYRELYEEDPDYSKQLLMDITSRSSGVFLWVYLVVHSLLEGLTNGDRVSDLEARLNELPRDLEALFRKILGSIESKYREHSLQLLQIHQAACVPLTLLDMYFADQEDSEAIFRTPTHPLTVRNQRSKCKRMKRRLMSRCKGFLEFVPIRSVEEGDEKENAGEEEDMKVEYLHRTVKDFIAEPKIWQFLMPTMRPFDPYVRLCGSTIMRAKTDSPEGLTVHMLWEYVTTCVEYAAKSEQTTCQVPDRLLDELDRTLIEISNHKEGGKPSFLDSFTSVTTGANKHWTHSRFSWQTSDPFPHLAAVFGLSGYLELKLNHDFRSACVSKPRSTPLLYSATCSGCFQHLEGREVCSRSIPDLELIKKLLESGADPNESCNGITAWNNVIQLARKHSREGDTRHAWLKLLEIFMDHGAMPKIDADSENWTFSIAHSDVATSTQARNTGNERVSERQKPRKTSKVQQSSELTTEIEVAERDLNSRPPRRRPPLPPPPRSDAEWGSGDEYDDYGTRDQQ